MGREQGATPQNIVGAIANEAGVESRYIGRIEIFDDYSTVDLPDGMPAEIFQHLRRVRVRQYPMNISRLDGQEPAKKRTRAKPVMDNDSQPFERKSAKRRPAKPMDEA